LVEFQTNFLLYVSLVKIVINVKIIFQCSHKSFHVGIDMIITSIYKD